MIGTVKRAENYMITVDLGRAEAVIRREDMIPKEIIKQGDRIRAQIKEVREEPKGSTNFLNACWRSVHGRIIHAGSTRNL